MENKAAKNWKSNQHYSKAKVNEPKLLQCKFNTNRDKNGKSQSLVQVEVESKYTKQLWACIDSIEFPYFELLIWKLRNCQYDYRESDHEG